MSRRAFNLVIGAAIVAGVVQSAAASGMDVINTHDGGPALSGTRATMLVNDLDRLLLEFNNDITWDLIVGSEPVSVLTAQPYDTRFTLGELVEFDSTTRLIYDRLAVRAVVQLIGYDLGELGPGAVSPFVALTEDHQLIALPSYPGGAGRASSPVGFSASEQSVPEPATLVLVSIGSTLIVLRQPRACGRSGSGA